MPDDSIMDMVNNIEPLYDDKNNLYRKWIREGKEDWDEKKARQEARMLAAHFAEAIEAMPAWPELRQPHYRGSDFDQAANEMIEEFKNDERPKWSDVPPSPGMGAVEGMVITHDGETIKTGFSNLIEAIRWFHQQHPYSMDHGVQYEGYDVVHVRNGKVVWSYKRDLLDKNKP